MKSMNDHDAQFGPYRATTCEWLTETTALDKNNKVISHECGDSVIPGKTYCLNHFQQAYRIVSTKIVNREFDRLARDPSINQSIEVETPSEE